MRDKKLEGVALVTGAGRGLGRAFSIGLAAAGMRVAAVARTASQIAETARLIEDAGGAAIALIADVSDPLAVRRMAEEARERLGPIGLLVNNAGAGARSVQPGRPIPAIGGVASRPTCAARSCVAGRSFPE